MKRKIDLWKEAGHILENVGKGVLMTTAADGKVNTMTIGWGTLGIQWKKPIFIAFVRQSRYTKELLDKNPDIDVLAMHTDSLAVLDAAEEKGIWAIGYNYDNSKRYPNTYLTAPVWEWEHFYIPKILECLQGKCKGDNYWEGVEGNIVSLAPLTDNVKDGIEEVVQKEWDRLKRGTFDVFFGPVTDRDGIVRVEEGENMSDDVLLNRFDWYVEGVAFNE